MIFQDNIVKEYLRNVYFIVGTPCGGKTTISRALGEAYGIPVYDIDEKFPEHQRISDAEHQPNMNQTFRDADEFFGRDSEVYMQWLLDNMSEQMEFVFLDLMRLAKDGPIICDCHLTVDQVEQISDPSRVLFMLREPVDLVDEYCNRPDHQDFKEYLESTTNLEAAKANVNETLYKLNIDAYETIKASKYHWIERDLSRSVEDTVKLAARYLELNK